MPIGTRSSISTNSDDETDDGDGVGAHRSAHSTVLMSRLVLAINSGWKISR